VWRDRAKPIERVAKEIRCGDDASNLKEKSLCGESEQCLLCSFDCLEITLLDLKKVGDDGRKRQGEIDQQNERIFPQKHTRSSASDEKKA
jgi:hypothetical protein